MFNYLITDLHIPFFMKTFIIYFIWSKKRIKKTHRDLYSFSQSFLFWCMLQSDKKKKWNNSTKFKWFYSISSLYICVYVYMRMYVCDVHDMLERVKSVTVVSMRRREERREGEESSTRCFLSHVMLSPYSVLRPNWSISAPYRELCADLDECEIYPRQRNRIQSTNMGALGPFTCKNVIRQYSPINGSAIHFMRHIDKQNLEK